MILYINQAQQYIFEKQRKKLTEPIFKEPIMEDKKNQEKQQINLQGQFCDGNEG